MHIARITPVIRGFGPRADTYVYECAQGHEITKTIERKT
jgi:hypothetical protein